MGNEKKVIGDVVELVRGNTYKSALLDHPGPFLLGLASIERNGGFRSDKLRTYGGPSADKHLVYPGDMYVSLKDITQQAFLLGSIARVPDDIDVGRMTQDTVKLVFKDSDYPKDLFYWSLRTPQYKDYCKGRALGTTNLSLSRDDFLAFELPEDNETRREIVSFLENNEKKITLNRQINQTLEQMAQTLFKSWFVDFDPVIDNALDAGFFDQGKAIPDELQARAEQRQALRHTVNEANKANQTHSTRTNPAAGDALASPYQPLPDDIRQLFPNEFEESELGWVPKGWAFKSVSEAIQVNPKVKLTKGDEAKFVDMKALPTSGYSIEDVSTKAFSGGAKFALNDVLLARITPCLQNGKTGFVDFLENDEVGFGSTEFIVLRATDSISHTYIACLARDEKFRQHAMQSMVGSSGRQRVQNSCFDDYYLAVPSCDVLNKFNEMTQPSFDKFKINTNENVALEKLRDALLPKLISGELRLDDVESTIAETTTA
ncbi:restriction endonuclease subunit S [Celerinatantimonas sp. YJH-8]|uniref:restriction endonuclease subunit S n=1 Tax=Celerinatantimonas sp. YJH-8 TaxID=3228714 RepID=UPI0038C4308D